MVELIVKKRNGGVHTSEELKYIIDGYTIGDIPDYQISAWLMAVYFNGLNDVETAALTEAMVFSGDIIDLSSIEGIKVDKHSTGGVGDKTTLILGPWVASLGVPVAKMSGRGLGHTGGTLDKLESIEGFRVDISPSEFIDLVSKHDIAICSQSQKLVPADKKLYALRDVTGTVDNISLIASSVMSKKLASGADAIIIDLKVGDGAFIKTLNDAEKLANVMISAAKRMNKKIVITITDMNQPLGYAIGNALEVKESIDVLQGRGPQDLESLCLNLGAQMLILNGKCQSLDEAQNLLMENLSNGKAFQKFIEWIEIQGGQSACILNVDLLPKANIVIPYISKQSGYVHQINAMELGLASMKLGAGRENKDSPIDYGAGIVLKKKVGDKVSHGDVLAELHMNNQNLEERAKLHLDNAFKIEYNLPIISPLILKTIQ